jgi:ABC-type multidrug transport system ATPase subunit
MEIILDQVSKRFNNDWLFKNLSYQFNSPGSYAIVGPNGSGKTTLLKTIAGMIPSTSGTISYRYEHNEIDPDTFYKHITFVAPYMELPEEFTLFEFLNFHFSLKNRLQGLSIKEITIRAGLEKSLDKPLFTFSSGMKQRVKLAIGFFTSTPIILLDEPTTNLDESGSVWYQQEIIRMKDEKMIIISSNQGSEYKFCDNIIPLKSQH